MLETDYGHDDDMIGGLWSRDPEPGGGGDAELSAAVHDGECSPPVGQERPQPPLGAYLQRLRRQKRFSQVRLADTAQISSQYLRQLELGYRPQGDQPVEPRPRVLRRLAEALADDHPEDADAIYGSLMELAGYGPLPPPPAPTLTLPSGLEEQRALLRALLEAELARLDDPLRSGVIRLVLETLSTLQE